MIKKNLVSSQSITIDSSQSTIGLLRQTIRENQNLYEKNIDIVNARSNRTIEALNQTIAALNLTIKDNQAQYEKTIDVLNTRSDQTIAALQQTIAASSEIIELIKKK